MFNNSKENHMKTLKKGLNALGTTGKILLACFLFYFISYTFGKR